MRFEQLQQRWHQLPGNTRGAIWTIGAAAGFSLMAVCIKIVGQTLSVWELVVLRTVVAMVVLVPICLRTGLRVFVTRRPGAHLLRSCLGIGGLFSFFLAVTHLDLALATTLGFTRSLFVIVLAVLFLGEVIRWRRSAATLVGFGGVLICLQPGTDTFEPWSLAALSFALFAAGVTTMVKRLTTTEQPPTILLYTYLFMGCLATVPAWFVWRTPNLEELTLVALMGLFSAAGQSCMVKGLQAGEATAITPFEYSRLLFAALLGFFIFAEVPRGMTWLGGGVIIASTLYIGFREARIAASRQVR